MIESWRTRPINCGQNRSIPDGNVAHYFIRCKEAFAYSRKHLAKIYVLDSDIDPGQHLRWKEKRSHPRKNKCRVARDVGSAARLIVIKLLPQYSLGTYDPLGENRASRIIFSRFCDYVEPANIDRSIEPHGPKLA